MKIVPRNSPQVGFKFIIPSTGMSYEITDGGIYNNYYRYPEKAWLLKYMDGGKNECYIGKDVLIIALKDGTYKRI